MGGSEFQKTVQLFFGGWTLRIGIWSEGVNDELLPLQPDANGMLAAKLGFELKGFSKNTHTPRWSQGFSGLQASQLPLYPPPVVL